MREIDGKKLPNGLKFKKNVIKLHFFKLKKYKYILQTIQILNFI